MSKKKEDKNNHKETLTEEEKQLKLNEILGPIQKGMENLHDCLVNMPKFESDKDQINHEKKIMLQLKLLFDCLLGNLMQEKVAMPFVTFTLMGAIEMLFAHPLTNPQKIMDALNHEVDAPVTDELKEMSESVPKDLDKLK